MIKFFADILEEYIQQQNLSSGRLATLSGVPKQTIQSWREGRVKRPRHIDPILRVAKALRLSIKDADRLLTAANHPSIGKVRKKAEEEQNNVVLDLLSFWQGAIKSPNVLSATIKPQPEHKIPFQALSRIHDFVGRKAEIDALSAELNTDGAVCILQGMGGVGKSTLANHLAYHLNDHFVDGVLWGAITQPEAGETGHDQRMMTLLRDFANAYGVDVTENANIESRGRVVRQLLSSKKALIILDGALGTEDVRHILPPSTAMCSVLITTRNRKMLADRAHIYCINSFSRVDSLTMLGNIIGEKRIVDERQSALKLIRFVGGLPLALRVIGSAIAEAGMVTLVEYCELLQSERSRLEHLIDWEDMSQNVRASFELSYGRLKPDQQQIYSQLALFGGQSFSANAVASLTQRPSTLIKIHLGRFRSLSLLEFGNIEQTEAVQQKRARYHFHPLLHTFAREKLGEPDPSLQKRLVVYYADFVEQFGVIETYTQLDDEWENIQAAVLWAHKQGWDDLFHRLLVGLTQLDLGVMGFLDVRGYWREGIAWFEQFLQTPTGKQNNLTTAFCYLKQGLFASYLSDSQVAQNALLQSYALVENPKNEQEALCHGYTCEALSRVTISDGLETMLSWSEKAIEQLERFDSAVSKQLQGYIFVRQSSIWGKMGDMDAGHTAVQKGIHLLPDRPTAARIGAYTNLGIFRDYQNDHEESARYWLSAIADAEQIGDARRMINLWQNLGAASMLQGDFAQALTYCNNVIEHARRIGAVRLECKGLCTVGGIFILIGRREEAAEKLRAGIALAQQWDVYMQEVACRLYYIELQLALGLLNNREELTRCDELVEKYDLTAWRGEMLIVKARNALLNQKYIEAKGVIEQALQQPLVMAKRGKVLQVKGKILVSLNQFDEAMNILIESAETLDGSDRFEYANTQFEIAKLRYKQDDAVNIRPDLEYVLDEFQKMGTTPKINEVQTLLASL